MIILLPHEGHLHLEITGTILPRLVLVTMMTTDVALHHRTEIGTLLRRQITGVAIPRHLILVIVAMAVLHLHLRVLMIDMIDEATAMGIILLPLLQGLGLLHFVAGMTMIGCLRGKLLAARPLTGN